MLHGGKGGGKGNGGKDSPSDSGGQDSKGAGRNGAGRDGGQGGKGSKNGGKGRKKGGKGTKNDGHALMTKRASQIQHVMGWDEYRIASLTGCCPAPPDPCDTSASKRTWERAMGVWRHSIKQLAAYVVGHVESRLGSPSNGAVCPEVAATSSPTVEKGDLLLPRACAEDPGCRVGVFGACTPSSPSPRPRPASVCPRPTSAAGVVATAPPRASPASVTAAGAAALRGLQPPVGAAAVAPWPAGGGSRLQADLKSGALVSQLQA